MKREPESSSWFTVPCNSEDLRFNDPALTRSNPRPGPCLDAFSYYQYVWWSKDTIASNSERRAGTLETLSNSLSNFPRRNALLVMGRTMHFVNMQTGASCF